MYKFNEMVGHSNIIKHMKNAYRFNKVSHAYILEGEEGMGKKLLAQCFVKLLQCKDPKGDEPCHVCSSCIQFESGNHPDIIMVNPTKKTGYGVSDIRDQIVSDINIKPYHSQYKVYIIEQADMMTVQAQNSLLKTIEEPPEYGLFFFLAANIQNFLPTILSRTVKISFKPIAQLEVEQYLIMKHGVLPEKARMFASFSRGNIGKAMMMMNSEMFNQQREDMLKVLDIFINKKEYDIMESVSLFDEFRDEFLERVELLISLIRDILYYKTTDDMDGLIHKDIQDRLIYLSDKAKMSKLIKLVDNANQVNRKLKLNVNYQLSTLLMLTNL
jgi:DNA polymerase-3 subunit delta'